MLDCETGAVIEKTLKHEGESVREFYASLPAPVVVGIEATGSMGWFLRLMEELAIECRVGHPSAIRKAETRRQKHDRRDAALLLQLLREGRFPAIWMPSPEDRDLRSLLLHRHQWVRRRTRVQNALRGPARLASLPLAPHTADRRSELQALYQHVNARVDRLDKQVQDMANQRARARLLMTHPGVGPVTALATEVFVGDPARFLDGKALASDVGPIPREYSSGKQQRLGALSKQGNPLVRFLWCEAAGHAGATGSRPAPLLLSENRAERVRESPRRRRAEARDSPLDHVARSDRLRRVLPSWAGAAVVSAVSVRQCPCQTWSSFTSGRNIDWATRLPRVEGVRTRHHGPP